MIYRSNLSAPDLQPAFRHVSCRPMGHSMGHDVLSDFADRSPNDPVFGLYKNCGFWTHDEAAILHNIAKALPGEWIDIGCHTGWTSAHIACAGRDVWAVDPMLPVEKFNDRFVENMQSVLDPIRIAGSGKTSNEFFNWLARQEKKPFSGIVIDGDHCSPCPLQDAVNASKYLAETGVILFHDFIGRPVRDGVEFLMNAGFNCRVYWTPHMVACCWRGDFTPPDHTRDPLINWESVRNSMQDFAFERCV